MNSVERFLLIDGLTKMAWGPWSDDSALGQNSMAGIGARIGAGFIPGVGAIMPAGDAINDFSHGRIGSGLLNTGLAGLGVFGLGGVGGAAARGLGIGAKALTGAARVGMGAKALGAAAEAAPTFAKGFRGGANLFSKAKGLYMKPFESMANTRMGGSLNSASKWTGAHPWKTTGGFMGAGAVAGKIDEASQVAGRGADEAQGQMKSMLENIHQNPVFENPIYAGGGRNPNYADVNPEGRGADQSSGPQMAGQLLGPALNYFMGR